MDKKFKIITGSLIAIVVLVVISNILIYNTLKTDFDGKLSVLNNKVVTVGNDLSTEKKNSEEQRNLLEEMTISNFEKLQDALDLQTTRLRLDLESVKTETESELEGITQQVGGLEERSSELEERNEELEELILDIDVTSSDFSAIAGEVIKAVVSIKTDKGQGSGVIFDDRGYVMTNKHVVEGITSAQVVDYESNAYSISIVGMASDVDLAVIKINSDKIFNYLNFASGASVGERVIAVGNPLGLSFTVTEGIISAVDRAIDDTNVRYVQTDVSINPGNSGGPLVNSNKNIVGINTLKISDTEGIGFAIPASVAKGIAEQALS
jgi:S1-C subfamily serine protease